ncbi:MAG TPA: FAD:protein FMN transferase [Thermoanaerobaculia bacterium]|nr:FAD:protein FMN transferase [Thermoanaerobaculia bacterium]
MNGLLVALLLAAAPASDPRPAGDTVLVERRLAVMGTALDVAVAAADRPTGLAAAERAVAALEEAERRLSTWRDDSELAALNQAPAGRTVELSAELAAELAAAVRCASATGGAFDPAVGPLVEAWGLRSGGRRPDAVALATAREAVRLSALDLEGRRATRRHPGLTLEEGGFGKGAGLDAAVAAALTDPRVRSVRLDLGGQVATGGAALGPLAVADPFDRRRPVLAVALDGGSLAVSGNSERGLVLDGERLGHLLDPRSGLPAPDFGAVAVWAASALEADCLATGLYVMGPEAALSWGAAHPPVGVAVLERVGATLRVRATAGLAARLRPLAAGVEIEIVRGETEQRAEEVVADARPTAPGTDASRRDCAGGTDPWRSICVPAFTRP